MLVPRSCTPFTDVNDSCLSNFISMSFPRIFYKKIANEEKHSQSFIDETLKYAEDLETKGLPIVFSTKHFSILTGVAYDDILQIVGNRSNYYKSYEISKRAGGKRQISSPHAKLRKLQSWIHEKILTNIEIHESAFGFTKGKSIVDNAKMHVNQEFILNIDLLNFFETITEKRVFVMFRSFGYHPNLAVDLAKICTMPLTQEIKNKLDIVVQKTLHGKLNHPVLPQGASTSPAISNIVLKKLDTRFSAYARKNNLKYTRYADDITFSGKLESLPKLSFLSKIVKSEGFEINWSKVKFFSSKSNKQIVTGLIVSDTVRVPKWYKTEVLRHLHFCEKFGVESHLEQLKKRYGSDYSYFREWLGGKIAYIKMVEPNIGSKMFETYNKIDWGL